MRMKSVTAMSMLITMLAAPGALAAPCEAPVAPSLVVGGSTLETDDYSALSAQMAAYDDGRVAYATCLNAVIFREVEASEEEVQAAREQRNAMYQRDAATGELYDPVERAYGEVTNAFLAGQEMRARAAALKAESAALEEVTLRLNAETAAATGAANGTSNE